MQQRDFVDSSDLECFSQALETLKAFCGMVLLDFNAHSSGGPRDQIIRGFIARGMTCTDSIFIVWQHGSGGDAWALHRVLLDRLFHLHYLADSDTFEAFEEYTFLRDYEARRKLLSEKEMVGKLSEEQVNDLRELLRSQEPHYARVKGRGPCWHRPKAEVVARNMGLSFLYRYGYHYASRYVHPMADEGQTDLSRLVAMRGSHVLPEPTVIENSILAQSMLVQEGLNASTMRWRAVVYDYLDQLRTFLGDRDKSDFKLTFYKIGLHWPDFRLCISDAGATAL